MIEFIDKTAEQAGTPLNRATLMALQGIQGKSIEFGDNTIIETAQQADKQGYVRNIVTTTTFNDDGSITVKVEGAPYTYSETDKPIEKEENEYDL